MEKDKKALHHFDVVIVGGGHAGCTLAILLGQAGLKVACVDRDSREKSLNPGFAQRTTAISFASQTIFKKAAVWDSLEAHACPIKNIEITESDSPPLLSFLQKDIETKTFGWVIENKQILKALFERMSEIKTIQHFAPAQATGYAHSEQGVIVSLDNGQRIEGSLLVGADGRQSMTRAWMGIATRGWSYRQNAIVFVAGHKNPHHNTAWENFRDEGPFAILPMTDDREGNHQSTVVWTQNTHASSSILDWSEQVFNAALQERFPKSYGRTYLKSQRFSYPLELSHAQRYVAKRSVLVADAAHGIHPIAGQGLNLGLRDVLVLNSLVIDAYKNKYDIGGDALLKAYEDQRRLDNMLMAGATDMLDKIFSNNAPPLKAMRRIGLRMIEKLPKTKHFLLRHAMGTGGNWHKISSKKK